MLSDEHKECLRKNQVELLNINPTTKLMAYMEQEKDLTNFMVQQIKNEHKTLCEQASTLLDIMSHQSEGVYRKLVFALVCENQWPMAVLLDADLAKKFIQQEQDTS